MDVSLLENYEKKQKNLVNCFYISYKLRKLSNNLLCINNNGIIKGN